MKLIDDWKAAWRLLSVQANTIGIAVSGTYMTLYDQLKNTLPPKVMAAITGGVFLLGIIGRMVSQTPKDDSK
jgi:hypothetical protein